MTHQNGTSRYLFSAAVVTAAMIMMVFFSACNHVMTMVHGGAKRPAESEFGLGPRVSSAGNYAVTLQPAESLRPRKLQTVQLTLVDANGQGVDGADITVDGGMPEHGHGLPTRPRVTTNLGGGVYVIEGVRFNMGGWWEFKLAINGKAGSDNVTFNLAL